MFKLVVTSETALQERSDNDSDNDSALLADFRAKVDGLSLEEADKASLIAEAPKPMPVYGA